MGDYSPGAAGSFMSGFSTAYTDRKRYQAQKDELALRDQERRDRMRDGAYNGEYRADPGSGGGAAQSGGGRTTAAQMLDPVSTDMPAYQRAFLNAVSDGESPGGAYNVRYTPKGGVPFDLNGQHPRIYEPTSEGKRSSAAGRYQFTYTTWNDIAGNDSFDERNQDHYAWKLAQRDYAARTNGGNLDAYLQENGMTPELQKILAPTWASMTSNQTGRAATYADSLARYTQPAAPVQRSLPSALSGANSPLTLSLGVPQ